jgi:hypothetical protein
LYWHWIYQETVTCYGGALAARQGPAKLFFGGLFSNERELLQQRMFHLPHTFHHLEVHFHFLGCADGKIGSDGALSLAKTACHQLTACNSYRGRTGIVITSKITAALFEAFFSPRKVPVI